jgi:hypothetical protein
MAVVYPITSNNCLGNHSDGTAWRKLKCVQSVVDETTTYTCSTWRYFLANCSVRTNMQCNPLSGAWVAACTVCRQQLW